MPVLKKDGTPGKKIELPPVEELQTNPLTRPTGSATPCYDAQGTWLLHEELRGRLRGDAVADGGASLYAVLQASTGGRLASSLTEMEKEGIWVDAAERLPQAEELAEAQREPRALDVPQVGGVVLPGGVVHEPGLGGRRCRRSSSAARKNAATRGECSPTAARVQGPARRSTRSSSARAQLPSEEDGMEPEVVAPRARRRAGGGGRGGRLLLRARRTASARPKEEEARHQERRLHAALARLQLPKGAVTKTGREDVDAGVAPLMAGAPFDDPPKYGLAHDHFGGGAAGAAACRGARVALAMGAIDTMLELHRAAAGERRRATRASTARSTSTPRPAASRRARPTCRTSPRSTRTSTSSGRPSAPSRATRSSSPTTASSSCASSRTSPTASR